MDEENSDSDVYKDITELKRQLEGVRGKKDISSRELFYAMQKLSETMTAMLEVFGTAAEQMKLQEKEYEAEEKKHDTIVTKLDKLIDQNKTIAQGMVAIVDMIKENVIEPTSEREETFKSKEMEEPQFMRSSEPKPVAIEPQPLWQTNSGPSFSNEQAMGRPMSPPPLATMPQSSYGAQLPPLEPEPSSDLDFPDEPFPLGEEPKKKGLFSMFKK